MPPWVISWVVFTHPTWTIDPTNRLVKLTLTNKFVRKWKSCSTPLDGLAFKFVQQFSATVTTLPISAYYTPIRDKPSYTTNSCPITYCPPVAIHRWLLAISGLLAGHIHIYRCEISIINYKPTQHSIMNQPYIIIYI